MNFRIVVLFVCSLLNDSCALDSDGALVAAGKIAQMWDSRINSTIEWMATNNRPSVPSSSYPFIFFHMRKCGGSSTRHNLVRSANQLHLKRFIPCHANVPCTTYEPSHTDADQQDFAILGGHFYYPGVEKYIYEKSHAYKATLNPAQGNYTCLTILREPVSRVISCWNYRLVSHIRNLKPLGSQNVSFVRKVLPTALSDVGEGCNNEFARVFSSSGKADMKMNTLTSDNTASVAVEFVLNETLNHMSRCVIGVLERCEDTAKAVSYFLPWFKSFSCKVHMNKNRLDKTIYPKMEDELRRQNHLDVVVYELANKLLDAQVARAKLENEL
mmetsp:Transcript_2496/g.3446  ORF Transcript_2496/g.3446 Transcript_2496/m.3446 type:complete len:328 (-) Transcript_2496:209-1192(-)